MKQYTHFTDYLKDKKLHFSEDLFNADMMYRAKIFNQYHRQYVHEYGETNDFLYLRLEVNQYEEKLHMQ